MGTVVALAGGVGGAKLAEGLYRLRGKDLAVVVNTADDYEHLGLQFCPDLDTVLYVVAGISNPAARWEPDGETYILQEMLRTLGGPERPAIGDRALAAPILRTEWMRNDRRLTQVTLEFCRRVGLQARILPMSDDQVRTHVLSEDGALTFHEYYNELGCEPVARGFEYAGADDARLSDEVLDALHAHDLEAVVLCPANPYHVIKPILAVNGMRELLRKRGAPVVAVTPIVGGKALKGSAGKMMRELGKEPSPLAAAAEYLRLIDGFLIDQVDAAQAESVRSLGIEVHAAPTIMRNGEDRVALARVVLDFARALREKKAVEAEG
jgi:LPPG:FO 2-phospho-L-lactate transferase